MRLSAALVLYGLFWPVVGWTQSVQVSADEEQRVLQLLQPGRVLAQQGKISAAIAAATRARGQVKESFGREDHWAAAYAMDDLARYRKLSRDFAGSAEVSRQAVAVAEREFGRTARFAYFAESSAALSYAAGDCEDARRNAEVVFNIHLAAEPNGADTQRAASTLINLLIQRGDIATALAVFHRVFSDARLLDANFAALALRTRLSLAEGKPGDAQQWLNRAEQAARSAANGGEALRPALWLLQAKLSGELGDMQGSERYTAQTLAEPNLPQRQRSEWLQALQQQALIQGYKGQYSDAVAGYTKVAQEFGKEYAGAAPPMIVLNHNLGWVYRALGDFKRAETQFNQALAAADACYGPANSLSLYVLYERIRLLLDTGRLNEALIDAERAVRGAESVNVNRDIHRAYSLASRALVRRRLGRLDEAQQDLLASLDLIRAARGGETWDLAPGYTELADIALRRQDFARAQEWAQAALTIRERDAANSTWATGVPLAQLMDVAAARQDWREVERHSERIVGIVQSRLGAGQARSESLVGELRRSRDLIERMLDDYALMPPSNLAAQQSISRVFAAMQLPHLTDLSVALRFSDETVVSDAASKQLMAQRRGLLEALQAVQSQLQGTAAGKQNALSAAAVQQLLRRSIELETELAKKDVELQRGHPQLAELLRPSLESLSAVQALLGRDEALYVQVVTESRTHGILLRADGVSLRSSPLNRSTVRRHVTRLRRALDLGLPLSQRLPFDYKAANDLYAGSLGLFEAELTGVGDLAVVLDDAFQNLPPAVLVTGIAAGGVSAEGAFLGEKFGLTIEPSVGAFRILRKRNRGAMAPRPFVGFGNPVLTGAAGDSRSVNALAGPSVATAPADLRTLPPLPETAEELKRIAQALAAGESTVYTQAAATESRVKSLDLSEYRVISFATHGLLAGEFRGLAQPALVMTPPQTATPHDDGLLTAAEVAALKLRAQLIILSACNTGRPDEGGGATGLSALARGFFFAGADSLIASHWAVSSEATVALVSEALRLMSAEPALSKAQALRRAMVRMMQGQAGEQFRGPAYWAPFVLIGDARPLGMANR